MPVSLSVTGAAGLEAAALVLSLAEIQLSAEVDVAARVLAERAALTLARATPRSPESDERGNRPHAADLWRVRQEEPGTYGLINDARSASGEEYVPFLFTGTQAHVIDPHAATMLYFRSGGGDEVFARQVHHPGTQPAWPLVQALGDIALEANRALDLLGEQTVHRVAREMAGSRW